LITLIQEKPVDEVTVQDVLDRAAVGRSTFYLHYRDKNDLLLSQLEMFLEMMSTALSVRKEKSDRVVPVAELFAHIGSQNKLYRALADAGRLTEFFELAQEYFGRGIAQRLRDSGRVPALPQRELAARASALAGSMLALFRWWLDRVRKKPPKRWTRCSIGWYGAGWDRRGLRSKSHDVVSAIHVDYFAGDAGTGVGGEEHSR